MYVCAVFCHLFLSAPLMYSGLKRLTVFPPVCLNKAFLVSQHQRYVAQYSYNEMKESITICDQVHFSHWSEQSRDLMGRGAAAKPTWHRKQFSAEPSLYWTSSFWGVFYKPAEEWHQITNQTASTHEDTIHRRTLSTYLDIAAYVNVNMDVGGMYTVHTVHLICAWFEIILWWMNL